MLLLQYKSILSAKSVHERSPLKLVDDQFRLKW